MWTLESIKERLIINAQEIKTFLKFAVVGSFGVLVNLGSFTLLIGQGLNKYIASPISIELSIISNFLLNNYWTFSGKNTEEKIFVKGMKFNVVSLLSLGVNFLTFVLLSLLFPDVMPQVHQAIGIIPGVMVNYYLNVHWTFKEKACVRMSHSLD